MQLSKYISELLLSHECVTVPALGSFISTFKSAHYDLTNEKFYPPSKNISFNSQINKNDGLLAKHISTKGQPAPYRDAMGRSDHRNRQRSPTPGDLLWHVGQPMSPGHQIHGLAVVTKI